MELQQQHSALVKKLRERTIAAEEVTKLREVITSFNERYEERRQLEERNPLLPDNILAEMRKK
jgi:hypothetical protein